MTFITLVLARCGYEGEFLAFGDDADSTYFGVMVVYGFFFLTMIQVIAIVLGDKNTVLVMFCIFLIRFNIITNMYVLLGLTQ